MHAVFKGLAVGVTTRISDILALRYTLMGYKWAEVWALGVVLRV